MKFNKRLFVLGLMLLVAIITLIRYFQNYDLKRIVRELSDAIEARDTARCLSRISPEYSDMYGHTFSDIRVIAKRFFDSVSDINVTIITIDVEKSDNRALVTVTFKLVGSYSGYRPYILGNMRDVAHAVLHLEKKESSWMIIEIENQELSHQKGTTQPDQF